MADWTQPKEVDDLTLAFPARVTGTLLPEWDDLPVEFQQERSPFCRLANALFAGRPLDEFGDWELNDGIDPEALNRHIRACLGSFEPKHEHKIAGVGYLLSHWFTIRQPTEGTSR